MGNKVQGIFIDNYNRIRDIKNVNSTLGFHLNQMSVSFIIKNGEDLDKAVELLLSTRPCFYFGDVDVNKERFDR